MHNSILYRIVPVSIKFIMEDVIFILNVGILSLLGSNTCADSTGNLYLRWELLCLRQNPILYWMVPILIEVIMDDVILIRNVGIASLFSSITCPDSICDLCLRWESLC
jgi:hypothetical protein